MRWRTARGFPAATAAATLGATIAVVTTFLAGGLDVRLLVLAGIAAGIAAWVTLVHPRLTVAAFAAVLSIVPYAKVPGTQVPLLLLLALGIWVACLAMPGTRFRVGLPELALLGFVATAGLSVMATSMSRTALLEYVAWVAATAVVVPVRALSAEGRQTLARTFAFGCALASAVGITLMRIDPAGLLLGHLAFLGYRANGSNAQYVLGVEHNSLRFTGTFVEPNIAGLVLAAGLLIAIGCTRGWLRAILVTLIGAGLALTLSRSALGTVVVALALVVLLVPGRRRLMVAGAGGVAGLALLAVPVVRDRLLLSFGPHDTGSLARELALQDFARSLDGAWWWGLGWDREEFRSATVGRAVNFVANAPLFTVYRGGVFVGAVAVLILALLVLRLLWLRKAGFEQLVLGCGVAGFCLVALQLDFPVVIQHPATAVFSVLVGLALGRAPVEVPQESTVTA